MGRWRVREGGGGGVRINEGGRGVDDTAVAVMLPALPSVPICASLAEALYRRESALVLGVSQSSAETVTYKLSTSTLCSSLCFTSCLCVFLSFSLSFSFSLFFSIFL